MNDAPVFVSRGEERRGAVTSHSRAWELKTPSPKDSNKSKKRIIQKHTMKNENLNEKFLNKVVQIFSCGSQNFKEMKNEEEIEFVKGNSFRSIPEPSLKRSSIHFSMMLDHLQSL